MVYFLPIHTFEHDVGHDADELVCCVASIKGCQGTPFISVFFEKGVSHCHGSGARSHGLPGSHNKTPSSEPPHISSAIAGLSIAARAASSVRARDKDAQDRPAGSVV